jgi:hypothetical protein
LGRHAGANFSPSANAILTGTEFIPADIFTMFDSQAKMQRIFDSGNIVIYDAGGLSGVTQTK